MTKPLWWIRVGNGKAVVSKDLTDAGYTATVDSKGIGDYTVRIIKPNDQD